MTADRLPSECELSPEVVLVMPGELRSQAIAALGQPPWMLPPNPRSSVPPPTHEPALRSDAPVRLLDAAALRLLPLAALFLVTTALTLILTLAANAYR